MFLHNALQPVYWIRDGFIRGGGGGGGGGATPTKCWASIKLITDAKCYSASARLYKDNKAYSLGVRQTVSVHCLKLSAPLMAFILP